MAKAFGATQAVRDASFELRAGEVHALVGENGCGKRTVVKILSGVHTPDAGEIELDGELVPSIRTPREAQSRGIFTVFQEVLVAESCSVRDNVWLGADDTWRTRVGAREKAARAKQMLGELLGREVDLHMAVEELSLSRSSGLRDRARARARPEDPDPRRGDLRARRRHARPPVRDRRQPLATRRRRDLHHAPHGRDRADRRPHHRDALRRDRGRARSRRTGRRNSSYG